MTIKPHQIKILKFLADSGRYRLGYAALARKVWKCPHRFGYRSVSSQGLGMKMSAELKRMERQGLVVVSTQKAVDGDFDWYCTITMLGMAELDRMAESERISLVEDILPAADHAAV